MEIYKYNPHNMCSMYSTTYNHMQHILNLKNLTYIKVTMYQIKSKEYQKRAVKNKSKHLRHLAVWHWLKQGQ